MESRHETTPEACSRWTEKRLRLYVTYQESDCLLTFTPIKRVDDIYASAIWVRAIKARFPEVTEHEAGWHLQSPKPSCFFFPELAAWLDELGIDLYVITDEERCRRFPARLYRDMEVVA